ncbi:MAG TPA: ComF family protein [Chitinophagaceae bacterium]|jgi:ComF family protein|nr:ComF family protein [Chitinophagaceae bacterium]
MNALKDMGEALLHLLYPQVCAGCGSDSLTPSHPLCAACLDTLPETGFHPLSPNLVEKVFWGRLPLAGATAHFYFSKGARIQQLMHAFKYGGRQELGQYLGALMGRQLAEVARFRSVDALVPLPLHPARERRRGFNQAAVLCNGLASVLDKPVLAGAVRRGRATATQTRMSRVQRWENMEGRFSAQAEGLAGKHLLLVDDVVTTGATLEACGRALLEAAPCTLSIATLCFSAP